MTPSTGCIQARSVCIFLCMSFLLDLLLCCQGAVCQGEPGRTSLMDMGVEWVDASGKVPPQLMIRSDSCVYPGSPSVHTFLAKPTESSPEAFLARYIQALPDTLSAIAYRDPAEDKTVAAREVASDQAVTKGIVDLRLNIRYDVGAFTLIEGTYVDTNGNSFPTAFYGIRASQDGYRITSKGISPADTSVALFFETGWNFYNLGPRWNKAPKPTYKYSFNLPGPVPASDAKLHPVTVFLNGNPSHLLIDSKTVPTDLLTAFVKRVVQVYRSGSQSQWLALWTQTDVQKNWNLNDAYVAGSYKRERGRFNGMKLYQVFTIDFGPNAAVFFADSNKPSSPLSHLLFWKEASGYRLTNGVALKSGNYTFDGNVEQLFDSPEFQKALQNIIGQPSSQKAVQRPSLEGALP